MKSSPFFLTSCKTNTPAENPRLHLILLILFLVLLLATGFSAAKAAEPNLSNTHELAKLVTEMYNDHLGTGYGGHEHQDVQTKILAVKFNKDTPHNVVKALEDETTITALTWHLSMNGHRLVAHLVPRAPLVSASLQVPSAP